MKNIRHWEEKFQESLSTARGRMEEYQRIISNKLCIYMESVHSTERVTCVYCNDLGYSLDQVQQKYSVESVEKGGDGKVGRIRIFQVPLIVNPENLTLDEISEIQAS